MVEAACLSARARARASSCGRMRWRTRKPRTAALIVMVAFLCSVYRCTCTDS